MLAFKSRTVLAGLAVFSAVSAYAAFAPGANAQLQPGDPRKIYPGADILSRPKPPPNPNFTHGVRVLPGGGYYGGGNVIIINGAPCYVPSYYGGVYGGGGGYYGGYNTSGYSVGFNVGGLSLGFNQASGYNSYGNVPPPVAYDYRYGYDNYSQGGPRSVQSRADKQGIDYQQSAASRRTPPPLNTREDDSNDYYLNRKTSPLQKDPSLAQAVRDIETAFRNGDIRLIEKHVDLGSKVALTSMGRSRRQLDAAEYIELTRGALTSIKTASYTLDKVEPASGGAWMVYGKHVLKGDNGAQPAFTVGFVLKKVIDPAAGDRWLITEVSADPVK